jgi:hypothetical protein
MQPWALFKGTRMTIVVLGTAMTLIGCGAADTKISGSVGTATGS